MSEGIRISLGLSVPAKQVWEAITIPEKFKSWFTACEEMELELRVGGKALFAGGSEEGTYRSEGVVLDVVEGKKLFHTVLEGQEPPWYGALLWHITEEGPETRLTLFEAGFQGREEEISEIEEGWRALLLSLCRYLEKTDRPTLPEEYYEVTGEQFASSFGYSYAEPRVCWERILKLHGMPELKILAPCGLIGDMAPPQPGRLLDFIEGKKLMYTVRRKGWDSVACWFLEDMGSETKISLHIWGFEEREEELGEVQKQCDEIMDRLVAGLDALAPEPRGSVDEETGEYNEYDMEGPPEP